MDTTSLVADRQQKFGFAPTTSMVALGEKVGIDLWTDQPSCCGLDRKPFLSGVVDLLNSVDDYAKGCYTRTA
jgi:hypothetical protein